MINKGKTLNNNKLSFIDLNTIIKDAEYKTQRKTGSNKSIQYHKVSKTKIITQLERKKDKNEKNQSLNKFNKSSLLQQFDLVSSFDKNNSSNDYLLMNTSTISQLDKSQITHTTRNNKSNKSKSINRSYNNNTLNIKKINSNQQIGNIHPLKKSNNLNKLDKNSSICLLHHNFLLENKSDHKTPLYHFSKQIKRSMQLIIRSNWGNSEVVGLKRINLIDNNGKVIKINNCLINKIIQQSFDVSNLLSMTNDNTTSDDSKSKMHEECWTYPFDNNKPLLLELQYSINQPILSIEIINYIGVNSTVSAKEIEIIKDSDIIWKGTLAQINQNDDNSQLSSNIPPLVIHIKSSITKKTFNHQENDIYRCKPRTRRDRTVSETKYKAKHNLNPNRNLSLNSRILVNRSQGNSLDKYNSINKRKTLKNNNYQNNIKEEDNEEDSEYITCDKIRLILLSNYGSLKQIGLTGIELADKQDRIVSNQIIKELKAFPTFSLFSDQSDNIIDNIVNNKNETTKKKNMFLTCLPNELKYKRTFIDISLLYPINLRRITIWNYNQINHLEKGTKEVMISCYNNNKLMHIAHCLLFKAPGIEGIDYRQTFLYPFEKEYYFTDSMLFDETNSILFNNNDRLKYETPYLPCGFIFKLVLLSTWGDDNYIGFNAIELYDHKETKAKVSLIYSCPEKCHIQSNTKDPFVFYLAKGNNSLKRNSILFINHSPICLSCVKIFNYSKHKEVGVKDIQLFCDNMIIYEGMCNRSTEKGDLIRCKSNETTIVFKPKEAFNSITLNDTVNSCNSLRQYKVIEKEDVKIFTFLDV